MVAFAVGLSFFFLSAWEQPSCGEREGEIEAARDEGGIVEDKRDVKLRADHKFGNASGAAFSDKAERSPTAQAWLRSCTQT